MADLRDAMRADLHQLAEHFEAMHDERDYLIKRVAELENPLNLTDEQKTKRRELADRLDHAADVLVGERKSPYGSVDQSAGLLFASLVGHIRSGDAQLSATLLRRADKLAAALIGEDNDRG